MDSEGELRRATLRAGRRMLLVALTAVALWAVWQVRSVVVPVLLAVFIASVTIPPTNRLTARGVNRTVATTVVWITLIALGTGLAWLLIPPTVRGIADLRGSLDQFTTGLQDVGQRFGLDQPRIAELTEQARQWASKQSGQIAHGAVSGIRTTAEIVIGAVLALILSIYFTHSGSGLVTWLADLAPAGARDHVHTGSRVAFDVVGRYIRGVAVVGFVDAFFIGIALWVLGVPIALPLAVLTWAGAFLPLVGAFVAGLLAAIVAFVAKGWVVALIVVAVSIAVQQLEGHVLAPQIYGKALALPGAVILVAIAMGSTLAGIVGAFLAAPVASVVVVLIQRARAPQEPGSPTVISSPRS